MRRLSFMLASALEEIPKESSPASLQEATKKGNTPMKRSLPFILVLGLMAALLASCGQAATGQQTGGTPTTSSHAHMSRIAWQGFLDHDQTTAAIFSANADGSDVRQLTHPGNGEEDAWPAWSPDGSTIIFTQSGQNSGSGDIFL